MTEQLRPGCRHSSAASGVFSGLVFIVVGLILLLDRMGIIEGREILKYWPLALVAAGAFSLVTCRSSRAWGMLMIIVGGVLSLRPLGLADWGLRELWPVLLIGLGIMLLWTSVQGRTPPGGPAADSAGRQDVAAADLDEYALFGGGERRIVTGDFRGGRVRATFGGWEIDLSGAGMKADEAHIEVRCLFGGVSLRVPQDWEVTARVVALLGGVSDNTRHPQAQTEVKAKRLIITGSAVLGGIEIKN